MNKIQSKIYAFVLGREQELCLSELKSVLSCFEFAYSALPGSDYRITGNVAFIKIDNFSKTDAEEIIKILGGTIKIFEILGSLDRNIVNIVSEEILKLKSGQTGKINFGISGYTKDFSRQQINSFGISVKKSLKGKLSTRFVESRDSSELSSILSLKNDLIGKGVEFGLFKNQLGVMLALNNPEEWSKRDYDKPAFDKYSGMLPPKLARMMINIALNESDHENDKQVILDPFCGSGNVLLEGIMLGFDVIGSDISDKAVSDSKTNVDWILKQGITSSSRSQVFKADATSYNFENLIKDKKRFIIVTEPFLGDPKKYKPAFSAARGEYFKIKELYFGFLKNIRNQLAVNGELVLCIVFPLVETSDKGGFSLFSESVDEIRDLGYTQACKSFIYGREYQVVKREIVLLKLI